MKLLERSELSNFTPTGRNRRGDVVGFAGSNILATPMFFAANRAMMSQRGLAGPAVWWSGERAPTILPAPPEEITQYGHVVPFAVNDWGVVAGLICPPNDPAPNPFFRHEPHLRAAPFAFLWEPEAGYTFLDVPDAQICRPVLTNEGVLGVTALFDRADYAFTAEEEGGEGNKAGLLRCPLSDRVFVAPYIVPSARRFVQRGGSWVCERPFGFEGPEPDFEGGGAVIPPLASYDALGRPRGYLSMLTAANGCGQLLVGVFDDRKALPAFWLRSGELVPVPVEQETLDTVFAHALFVRDDGTIIAVDYSGNSGELDTDHLTVYGREGAVRLTLPAEVLSLELRHTVASPSGRFIAATGFTLRPRSCPRGYDRVAVPVIWERHPNGRYGAGEIPTLPQTYNEFVNFVCASDDGTFVYREDDVFEDGPITSYTQPVFWVCGLS